MNKGKPVVITSLAMRFLVGCGWTEADLEPYLSGRLVRRGFGPNEEDDQYFILSVGSKLDVDKMFEDGIVGEVFGKSEYGETRNKSDIEAMKIRNW